MQVLQINLFSMVKLRETRGEREIGLFITTRIQQFEESNKKKIGKIISLLDVSFICLFQLYLSLVIADALIKIFKNL